MKRFDYDKTQIEHNGHKYTMYTDHVKEVIIKCSYAGYPVIGRAMCNSTDQFDIRIGKELALLRCDAKVAKKKATAARKRFNRSQEAALVANNRHFKNTQELYDYRLEQVNMEEAIVKFIEDLAKKENEEKK